MELSDTLTVASRAEWRAWLAENHSRQAEVWLAIFKGRAARAGVAYADAVEEALCFGWIDSQARRIDDEKYAQRFSPRRRVSAWSDSNIQRVRKLIAEGCVTPAGLAVIPPEILRRASEGSEKQEVESP